MPTVACSVETLLAMKKFEYKIISPLIKREDKLNELGYLGWELVAVSDVNMYLKREING